MFPVFNREPGKTEEVQLKAIGERIEQRLQKSGRTFPFEAFKKKRNLTLKEEMIILALLKRELFSGEACEKSSLLELISQTRYERLTHKTLFEKRGRLVREKMIKIEKRESIFGDSSDETIRLNPSLMAELSGEKKMGHRAKLLKDETFFEVITPSVPLEKVILHPGTYDDIHLAIEMIQGEASRLLSEWGIKGADLIQQTAIGKKRQPVTLLFYGDPGTGKTLTANAMAHALKRKLLTLDCSKMLSKWVGDSEQNVRKIFDRYREISKEMKTPPVLLLNEADQFFHMRVSAKGSVDHMYNQMQNIFLEQLERFEGILIATTNLKENMDSAFSRRFHHKIEFKRPKQPEILKLWKIHLPANAPLAEDVDLEHLSGIYDLSGGQIAVAVRNAATRGARRGDRIYQEDLIKACEDEISGNFDEKSRGRIGFGGKGIIGGSSCQN
ncbi:MAG: ATP-binding protein [Nitrospirae bacterium]|nr:ATP-binding protein [Nitrospirota bacterium]